MPLFLRTELRPARWRRGVRELFELTERPGSGSVYTSGTRGHVEVGRELRLGSEVQR